jgi:crossover junction endodeoxyribonuclease RuvC
MITGIDVGLTGAVAFFDPAVPGTVATVDIPVHMLARGLKSKREIDIARLTDILTVRRIDHAFVEQVGAMPGQGVSGVFAFGKAYGVILGIIVARNIPLSLVPPVRWKRALHVPKAKDGARARASQLFPEAAHQWQLKKHDGRAEAALIALYGARNLFE